MREWLLRVLLKIGWAVGGALRSPPLRGSDVPRFLPHLAPGDFVLLGTAGRLSHVAVHLGGGELVHAMATEKTMRGWTGALLDAVARTLGRPDRFVGVLREPLAQFLDRFDRDTLVIARGPALDEPARQRALARVASLVGQPYDYGFRRHNAAYYCTELVEEYLVAALGDAAPPLPHTHRRVPWLLDEDVIEPAAVLKTPGLTPVAATPSAVRADPTGLRSATVV